jgi:hypothetical protein
MEFLIFVCGVLSGACMASTYWLYQLWRSSQWKVKQLERALWEELPPSEVPDADLRRMFGDED